MEENRDFEELKEESLSEELSTESAEETVAEDESSAKSADEKSSERGLHKQRGGGPRKKNTRRNKRTEAVAEEFTEKVIQVRRVTKVVKGGKKLSFRVAVIIGNEKGRVGVGVGKAAEVLIAIKKAITDAKKRLVDVQTVGTTVSHTVIGSSGGAKLMLKPAAEGTGVIAGGTARIVLELAGVGDVLSKSQGSKSPLNVARATVDALLSLRTFQEVASSRGLSVKSMLSA